MRTVLIILASVLIVAVIAVVAAALWAAYAPSYAAVAYLAVSPPIAGAATPCANEPGDGAFRRTAKSNIPLAKSDVVLSRALETKDIRNSAWFEKHKDDPVRDLADAIRVAVLPGTDLIALSMTGTDRKELPDMVNTVAREFVEETRKAAREDQAGARNTLEKEVLRLRSNLNDIRRQMILARPEDIPNIQDRRNVLDVKIQSLSAQATELELQQARAAATLDTARKQQEDGTLAQTEAVRSIITDDPLMQSLRDLEAGLLVERTALAPATGPAPSAAATAEARLAAVRREIDERRKQLLQEAPRRIVARQEQHLKDITDQLLSVSSKYAEATTRLRQVETTLTDLQRLAHQEQLLLERSKLLEDRLLELQLASQGQGPIRVRQWATPPRKPSPPKWGRIVPAGAVLGLLIGGVLAAVRLAACNVARRRGPGAARATAGAPGDSPTI